MFYSEEELNAIFNENKKLFDNVYSINKDKYGETQANVAMYEYFVNYRTDFITRTNGARSQMQKMEYHGEEIDQFIIEYAMSSYILSNREATLSLDEIRSYANPNAKNLKYDRDSIIEMVAIGGAWSPYWLTNVFANNQKVKEVLIQSLIEERYIENKKEALDNCKKAKLVRFPHNKPIMISITGLNRSIDNMIRDDEKKYFKDDDNDYKNVQSRGK